MAPRVLVLGAGISGMTCAVCVQQACPQAHVLLVSEHFSPTTTGDGSAGFWEPIYLGAKNTEETMRLCDVTFRYMFGLAHSPIAGLVKAQKLSGYHFYKGYPAEIASWHKFVEGFRQLTKEELKRYPGVEAGTFHTTVTIDVSHYMKWLMERFKRQGGEVRQARVNNIEEIGNECDILINCSATSSRHLFKDESLFPIRGQVWKVHAPWIKHFYIMQEQGKETAYILPGVDHVTVGGSAVANDWNTIPDPEEGRQIWDRALSVFPQLRYATPLKIWAGLRPARDRIRLEAETVNVNRRKITVIHNYGHGGSGVTLHWGCAQEVTRMVLETLGAEKNEVQRIISRL